MSERLENKNGGNITINFFVIGLAIAFIAIGVFIILGSWLPETIGIRSLWPLFMMIPVVILVGVLAQKGKSAEGVLVPIMILTCLTVYFLILNYTSWGWVGRTWPTFILIPAIGLFSLYLSNRQKGLLIPVGILTLVSVIFYGFMFSSGVLAGVAFIAAGVLVIASFFFKSRKNEE